MADERRMNKASVLDMCTGLTSQVFLKKAGNLCFQGPDGFPYIGIKVLSLLGIFARRTGCLLLVRHERSIVDLNG